MNLTNNWTPVPVPVKFIQPEQGNQTWKGCVSGDFWVVNNMARDYADACMPSLSKVKARKDWTAQGYKEWTWGSFLLWESAGQRGTANKNRHFILYIVWPICWRVTHLRPVKFRLVQHPILPLCFCVVGPLSRHMCYVLFARLLFNWWIDQTRFSNIKVSMVSRLLHGICCRSLVMVPEGTVVFQSQRASLWHLAWLQRMASGRNPTVGKQKKSWREMDQICWCYPMFACHFTIFYHDFTRVFNNIVAWRRGPQPFTRTFVTINPSSRGHPFQRKPDGEKWREPYWEILVYIL